MSLITTFWPFIAFAIFVALIVTIFNIKSELTQIRKLLQGQIRKGQQQ